MGIFDYIIIAAVAAALVFAVIRTVKKKGGCGCGCGGCSGCSGCGKEKK